jgi:hypothetical protein
VTAVLLVVASEDDGGLARVASTLAAGLPGHGVTVAAAVLQRAGRLADDIARGGVPIHIVPELIETLDRDASGRHSLGAVHRNLRGLPTAVRSLRAIAEKHGASVYYAHGSWPNHVTAAAARGDEGRTAVWHVHTAPSRPTMLAAGVMRARSRVAAIAVSEAVAGAYRRIGVATHVVHNGTDLEASRRGGGRGARGAGVGVKKRRRGAPPPPPCALVRLDGVEQQLW